MKISKIIVKIMGASICGLLLMASVALAKDVEVQTTRARIRSGPGNYHKVIYTAYRGAKLNTLSEEKGWYKVKLRGDKIGYVSKRSIEKRKRQASNRSYRSRKGGVGSVSSGQIMAATRGVSDMGMFAKKYAEKNNIDPALLEELSVKPYTTKEYRKFVRKFSSPSDLSLSDFSGAELDSVDYDIGAAIAMKILATHSPSPNKRLQKYVALVGTALVEKTPLYDEEFIFVVLDNPTPQSYSTPGGYVFITTGAIKSIKTEAELAGVLAHEIVHVTERHGMKELDKQSTHIATESAMDELDAEIDKLGLDDNPRDQEYRAVAEEMNDMANEMFENIIGGRKGEAEDEADKLGTALIAKRGYNPLGFIGFIKNAGESGNEGRKTSTYRDTNDRINMIQGYISKKSISRKRGKDFKQRFKDNAR